MNNEFKSPLLALPLGSFLAVFMTAVLFVLMPVLTTLSQFEPGKKEAKAILISTRKPAAPPPEDRDENQKMKRVEKTVQQKKSATRTKQNYDIPKTSLAMAGSATAGVQLGIVKEFEEVSKSLFVSAFKLNEVDEPPRLIRSFPPQYPFIAKRDGIEGSVMLRFVVDTEGQAREPEVVQGDPPGIFDEAALKVVQRYKFKPAKKKGQPVDCIVKQSIKFTME